MANRYPDDGPAPRRVMSKHCQNMRVARRPRLLFNVAATSLATCCSQHSSRLSKICANPQLVHCQLVLYPRQQPDRLAVVLTVSMGKLQKPLSWPKQPMAAPVAAGTAPWNTNQQHAASNEIITACLTHDEALPLLLELSI